MVRREHQGLTATEAVAGVPSRRARLALPGLAGAGRPLLGIALGLLLVLPMAFFLAVAVSPRLFAQGPQWFTLSNFAQALSGQTLQGLVDSLVVGVVAAAVAVAAGSALAWLVQRTTLPGRRIVPILVWAVLLSPSYLSALGWERLVEPDGVLAQMGLHALALRHLVMGPIGVTLVLATRGVPFAFLTVSAALLGLGSEFEEAARVHGASRWGALRVALPIVAPALWSAAAIVFAESISDFGVASTLAADAHFPVATYTLFTAIDSTPIEFGIAAAVAWLLVAAGGLAIVAQQRALRGRSYAVLGGRTRLAGRHRLGPGGMALGLAFVVGLFLAALGIPVLGAVSASLLKDFGAAYGLHAWTLSNYRRVFTDDGLLGPILLSARMAAITATLAVVIGLALARLLVRRSASTLTRVLDLALIGAVAVPTVVLAAGYIFAYNLPILARLGVSLYGTLTLLGMGYLAGVLPTLSRMLIGPVAQVQASMVDAARVHGAGGARTWQSVVVPLLARPILWAWLFAWVGTLLELPISQLLYPPGEEPLSVAITKHLANYDFGGGTAMMVVSVLGALAVVGAALGLFRLLVPAGWRRAGS